MKSVLLLFRRTRVGGALMLAAAIVAAGAASASCTSTFNNDASSSYLIIDSLGAFSGAKPGTMTASLDSDVVTMVKKDVNGTQTSVPTIYEDGGQVTLRLALKDPGTSSSPTVPSTTNFITVNQYHVSFVRSDGRNTPGVDVPYPFDGAATFTVGASPITGGFALVRIQAKSEAPLRAMAGNAGAFAISTIAEITFYGTDQAGHAVSVTGRISVTFADWGDPA